MTEAGMRLAKMKMKKSCDDGYRPYKVSYPGRYDPYELRPSKDPRLGTFQKMKENFYREHGFKDDDDDDDDVVDDDVVDDDDDDDGKLPPVRVVTIPYNGTFTTNFSPSMSKAESSYEDVTEHESTKLPFSRFRIPYNGPFTTNFSPSMSKAESSYEDVTEHESTKLPFRRVRIPYNGPFKTNLSPSMPKAESAKSFEHHWKNKLKQAVKHEAKYLKETDCECAEAAIKSYNQKHGTDYKIVETLGSYGRIYTGFWFHCNFRAQCCESDPSPPKLFFAELNRTDHDNLIVKDCMPLDDGLVIRSPIVRGCGMCGNQLLHPVNGFQVGKFGSSSSSCRAVF